MSELNDARIKAEQLAAEKYRIIAIDGAPSGHEARNAFVDGYLAARAITAELAAAWDEGHQACHDDYQRDTGPLLTPNPYRDQEDQ